MKELIKTQLKDDTDIKRVDILLTVCGQADIESECLRHIITNTKHPYRLIVYDNRPDSIQGIGTYLTKVWNKLVKQTMHDYICMMTSDVFVKQSWLEEMMSVFEKYQDVGVVVPLMGSTAPNYIQEIPKENNPYEVNEQVSGCCFLFKKEVFKKVGDFDEKFYFYGQDEDWFRRVLKAGYKIYLQPSTEVWHGKRMSIKKFLNE